MPLVLPAPDVQSQINAIYNQVLTRTYVSDSGQRVMLLIAYGGDQYDGTSAHLCSLLTAALRSPRPPTAYLVTSAMHALTVTMHLLRNGRRIPQDVAVISREDDLFLPWATPAITHYAIDADRFARRISTAARQLAATGTLEPRAIRMIPKFVAGETV